MNTKSCRECKLELPLKKFKPQNQTADGRMHICEDCWRKRNEKGKHSNAVRPNNVIPVTGGPELEERQIQAKRLTSNGVQQADLPNMPKPIFEIALIGPWITERIERGSQSAAIAELELRYFLQCEHQPPNTPHFDIKMRDLYGGEYYADVTTNPTEFESKVREVKNGRKGQCTHVILFDMAAGKIITIHGPEFPKWGPGK